MTDLRTSGTKRAADIQRRNIVVTSLLETYVGELETSLVDRRRFEYRSVRHLQVLIDGDKVEGSVGKSEAADAVVVDAQSIVVVTNDQCVVRIDCVVKAWTEVGVSLRNQK